jgi:hypothetical protein
MDRVLIIVPLIDEEGQRGRDGNQVVCALARQRERTRRELGDDGNRPE